MTAQSSKNVLSNFADHVAVKQRQQLLFYTKKQDTENGSVAQTGLRR
jgi:hypothetical protein